MASDQIAPPSEEAVGSACPTGLRGSGLTVRAVTLSVLVAAASGWLIPYLKEVHGVDGLGFGYFPFFGVMVLLFMVFVLNVALKLIRRGWALRPQELVVILVVILIGAIADHSLATLFVATLATPYYHATPENEWAKLLHDHIPRWITPDDTGKTMTWFFNGLPAGESIPWAAWVVPLLWWMSFLGAFFLICIALVALFRKQWVENERLAFPLMNTPMALIRDSASERLLPHVTRSWAFLVGFLLIFTMLAYNVVTFLQPGLTRIKFGGEVDIGGDFPPIIIAATPWVIGLCYFVNPQVLFSFWFFQVLVRFEEAFFNRIGFTLGAADMYESSYASLGWQSWGAFSVFILYGVWAGRHHLAQAFRKAWRGLRMEHDEPELMSSRMAVLCILVGLVYMVAFMAQTGMSAIVIALFAPAAILCYFGATRLVIEAGLPYMRPPIPPQSFTMYTLGSAGMSGPSMVGIAFSYAWIVNMWSIFMPAVVHGAKLADSLKMSGRTITIATVIGLIVTVVVMLFCNIYLGYSIGANNFTAYWTFQGAKGVAFDYVTTKMRNPQGPDYGRLKFMGIGGTVMSFLIFMRHRFPWWPLHPIGLTCPFVVGTIRHFGSFLLTWLAKVIIIAIGGLPLYERGKPFFIGLVVGHLAGSVLYVIADVFFFPQTSIPLVRYY